MKDVLRINPSKPHITKGKGGQHLTTNWTSRQSQLQSQLTKSGMETIVGTESSAMPVRAGVRLVYAIVSIDTASQFCCCTPTV